MGEIKYAPVIIFTICRHKHFKNEIESLKKNAWAKYTDVYIGFDYPAKAEHWDGYKKICEYLEMGDFSVFKSFNVIRREKNYGPAKNRDALLNDIIYKQYDRWIYLEDDIILSPNFIEYIDKCLALYEDNDDILAVNAYSQELDWLCDNDANIIFQSSQCSAWGLGHWKKKYDDMRLEMKNGYLVKNFDRAYKTGLLKNMIKCERYKYIFETLIGKEPSLILAPTDTSHGAYLELKNKYVVTPRLTKARNMGFDGSGETCVNISNKNNRSSMNYDYSNQPIDTAADFEPRPDSVICREENKKILDDFKRLSRKHMFVTHIAFAAYRILGVNLYKKLVGGLMSFVRGIAGKIHIFSKFAKYYNSVSYKYLEKYTGDRKQI